MMFAQVLAEIWILIPVAILLVSGFAITLRSVDVRLDTIKGAREVAENATYMAGLIVLTVLVMLLVQQVAGYNLHGLW
jgi:uncharacterized membrane protein YdcZ (DUF606 family)